MAADAQVDCHDGAEVAIDVGDFIQAWVPLGGFGVMARAEMPFFRDPQPPIRPWLFRQLRQLADELALPTVRATAPH